MKGGSRPPTGNFSNYVGFLRSPNVRFDFHNETDAKRRAEMEAAGRRIADTIAYGWDYLRVETRGALDQAMTASLRPVIVEVPLLRE